MQYHVKYDNLFMQDKCHQYWPNSGVGVYGTIKVTLQKEEELTNYCLRQFVVEQVCFQLLAYPVCYSIHRLVVLKIKHT